MTICIDTNIAVAYLRESPIVERIDRMYSPFASDRSVILSVVIVGELRAFGMKNAWGKARLSRLDNFINQTVVVDINIENLIDRYAAIDAYSQGRHPTLPSAFSARNMGKNDLWIAATASVLDAPLLTMDQDFAHLDQQFLTVHYVDPKLA